MSSAKDTNASTDDTKGSSGGKQASPGHDTGSKSSDSKHAPSAGGHEETGAEKFSASGSGGVPARTDHGYEKYKQ